MRSNWTSPQLPDRTTRHRALATPVIIAAALTPALVLAGCGRSAPTDALANVGSDPDIAGVSITSPDAVVSTVVPPPAETTTSIAPLAPQQILHTVEPGDTLSGIAGAYGVSVEDLADYNGITDPHSLKPGQELAIPPQPAPAETDPATEAGAAADDGGGGTVPGGAGTSDTTIDG
jgi:LysM repeat protein